MLRKKWKTELQHCLVLHIIGFAIAFFPKFTLISSISSSNDRAVFLKEQQTTQNNCSTKPAHLRHWNSQVLPNSKHPKKVTPHLETEVVKCMSSAKASYEAPGIGGFTCGILLRAPIQGNG